MSGRTRDEAITLSDSDEEGRAQITTRANTEYYDLTISPKTEFSNSAEEYTEQWQNCTGTDNICTDAFTFFCKEIEEEEEGLDDNALVRRWKALDTDQRQRYQDKSDAALDEFRRNAMQNGTVATGLQLDQEETFEYCSPTKAGHRTGSTSPRRRMAETARRSSMHVSCSFAVTDIELKLKEIAELMFDRQSDLTKACDQV
jgi:hypothetical protein